MTLKDNIATIKLMSGEELLAIVEKCSNPLHLKVINPVVVYKQNTMAGPVLSVSHWLMFTEENEIIIDRKNIVAIKYGIEDNAIEHYLNFTRKRGDFINFKSPQMEDILKQLGEKALQHQDEDFELEIDLQPDVANTTIH
jgi:dihydroorotate dehydrogenase